MTATTKNQPVQRKVYRNINIFTDVRTYRLPAAGFVSILHRVSGLLMFLLLPFIIWMFDNSLSSEISYESFTNAFVAGIGFVPAWFVKLVVLALAWSYFHHFIAGVRHLWMDATHSVSKQQGKSSAVFTLTLSLLLTLLTAAKLFGVY
jgi:succinate dehydrogenase / fumarate reductase cytochrome b subunit